MATAENIAIERRVAAIEDDLANLSAVYVRTTIVVCERGPEPDYRTVGEVIAAAEREPVVREVRRFVDLELLINPRAQTRKLRHKLTAAGKARFDEVKNRPETRLVDVEIRCHEKQVRPILSKALTVAAFGGNRAGKSMILVWRLFRRWMLRGGPRRRFWWVAPNVKKLITEGVWVIAGPLGLGGGVWPDELFVGLRPCTQNKKDPSLRMIDGSTIHFEHAAYTGQRAGSNLKSANITDAVVDEVGAIGSEANWHQVQIRVSQTGGSVAASTTRVRNHWSHAAITLRAEEAGPEVIDVSHFDLFESPWMSYARIWQLFLNDRTLTRQQLENIVLPAEDKRAACLSVVTSAKSLREHFGEETETSRLMWTEWSDDLIYASDAKRHKHLFVERDGRAVKLINITAAVMAKRWQKHTTQGKRFEAWAGMDFNVRGHAVVLELFGQGGSVEEAVANSWSWTVLVSDEVQVDGTTMALAEKLEEQAGIVPVWFDPQTRQGHAARGTGNSSDAAVLRKMGMPALPAAMKDGKAANLSQIDSCACMNALMRARRYFVHERCVGVIEAMHKDLQSPDGKFEKRSSPDSMSDFISGYSDSARYGIWPVFKTNYLAEKPE